MNPSMPEYRRLAAEDPIELARRLASAEAEIERLRAKAASLRRQLRRAREGAGRG